MFAGQVIAGGTFPITHTTVAVQVEEMLLKVAMARSVSVPAVALPE